MNLPFSVRLRYLHVGSFLSLPLNRYFTTTRGVSTPATGLGRLPESPPLIPKRLDHPVSRFWSPQITVRKINR